MPQNWGDGYEIVGKERNYETDVMQSLHIEPFLSCLNRAAKSRGSGAPRLQDEAQSHPQQQRGHS
jgi:hypothetical protein